MGAIVDGEQKCFPLMETGQTVLRLVDGMEDKEHSVLLFKRMDSCHEVKLEKLELSAGSRLLTPSPKPDRRIEVYGDSVSAGEVSEAVDYVGAADPEHNGEYSNSWYSYSWITARKLGAELHDIAQGGIALMDHTGWLWEPDAIGMEQVWDKVHYQPPLGAATQWDFSLYRPQVVIVAIGQNDSHPDDYMAKEKDTERGIRWKNHYRDFIRELRRQYPEAYVVCITTLLGHDAAWDRAIDEVCADMKDEKVTRYHFARNGCGTAGHLRIPEAEEMAEELAGFINSLGIEGWTE